MGQVFPFDRRSQCNKKSENTALPPASTREICALITTYRPDDGFPARVERVRSQVGLVIIIDDGASVENAGKLRTWFGGLPDVVLHHNPQNVGLSAALNSGVSIARTKGFNWLLTLDDDTLVTPTMIERLLIKRRQFDDRRPVGLAGMSWTEAGSTTPAAKTPNDPSWADKRGIITSGSLFSIAMYDAVGPFREDYIIGAIDYEYCMRARAKGFRIVKFAEIGFEQRLGRPFIHRLGPLSFRTYNYSAPRYYYGFRNNLMNVRANALRDPLYAMAVCIYILKTFLTVGLFEADGHKKARFMLLGLWHGIIGKMGKRIDDE
jgi:rhamnosyltransferase